MTHNNASFSFADKCSGLPDLPKIETKIEFPVIVGTKVEISCIPGHQLSGSSTITCVKDTDFVIEQRPFCQIGLALIWVGDLNMNTTITCTVHIWKHKNNTRQCKSCHDVGLNTIEITLKLLREQIIKEPYFLKELLSYAPNHSIMNNQITRITTTDWIFADICTGLLIANSLQTNTTFPVEYNSPVTVACTTGLTLLGPSVILCEQGINYKYPKRPSCVDPCEYPGNFSFILCGCWLRYYQNRKAELDLVRWI